MASLLFYATYQDFYMDQGGGEGVVYWLGRKATNPLPVLTSWLRNKLWEAELLCPLRKNISQ